MDDAVRFDTVSFSYDGHHDMHFDTAIASREFVAILGASGSGKSTMLSLLAGFEACNSGSITLTGRDATNWPPAKRPISMVFQENNLFAHLSVADNVGLGLTPDLKLTAPMKERRVHALERTGLAALHDRRPDQLSGGQRQRVALARALVRDHPILLLDEAFASLGPGLRREMLALVRSLHDEKSLTTLMVTHAPEDASQVADRVLFVDNGRIVWDATANTAFSDPSMPDQVSRYLMSSNTDKS